MVFISADVRSLYSGVLLPVLSFHIACVCTDPYLFSFYVCTHMETQLCVFRARFTIIVQHIHKDNKSLALVWCLTLMISWQFFFAVVVVFFFILLRCVSFALSITLWHGNSQIILRAYRQMYAITTHTIIYNTRKYTFNVHLDEYENRFSL